MQALLAPGEPLLWCSKAIPTGRSEKAMVRSIQSCVAILFMGVVYCTNVELHELPHSAKLLLSLFLLFLPILTVAGYMQQYLRMRHYLYAITPSRAIMLRGKELHQWPLTTGMIKEYKAGAAGSIIFSYTNERRKQWRKQWQEPLGFLHCSEAEEALAILQRLLGGQACPYQHSEEESARRIKKENDAQDMRIASSPGALLVMPLVLLLSLGGIGCSPWWWSLVPGGADILLLLMALSFAAFSAFYLRSYFRGKKLLAQKRQS